MSVRHCCSFLLGLALVVAGPAARAEGPRRAAVGPEAKVWEATVDRAIGYLRRTQASDGSWSRERSPGVTGVCVTGLVQTGRVSKSDPVVANGIKYIEGLINRQAGHIAGKDPRPQLQNYVTSINVLALQAADRDSYKEVIGDAAQFLRKLQWDEGEGKGLDSDFYGGAGYDSKSRPDLSNTQMFLDALVAAGVPKDDPALKKALVFVSRCQNLKGEHNDRPWADKVNDGTFIYSAAAGGQTKTQDAAGPDGALPGYGSMTYAGIKSMIYCGVSKDDPRVKKAYEWVTRNYTVDRNPGMPGPRGRWGLYYYYHTMSKCLEVMGVDEVVTPDGVRHNWRAELTAVLARQQRPDGGWASEERWMEADANLVTAYALMSLSHCRPPRK